MTFNPLNFKYSFKEFVGIYEDAFTAKECEDTIKQFEAFHKLGYTYSRLGESDHADRMIRPSTVLNYKNDTASSVELDWDPGFIECFHSRFYNYIYPFYNIQYPILQTLTKHQSKYIKVQKTIPTQGYHVWHCEHDSSYDASDRILAWILYLNDVEDGGETEFIYQSLRFKPKQGTFILFPAHFTHTHRGNPPLSGEKYIATGWIEFMHTPQNQGASIIPDLNHKGHKKNSNIEYN